MTANRIFWLMLLAVAVYLGADQLAEYVGSAVGSVWVAAAIGIVAGLIAQFAFHPFVKRAQEDGYLEKTETKSVPAIIWQSIVFAAVTTLIIFAKSPASPGAINYTKPFVLGFWAAIFVVWLIAAVTSRTLDSSQ